MTTRLIQGHTLEILPTIEAGSVQAVCTSPPYLGLRRYQAPDVTWPDGWIGQLGLEDTPQRYIAHLVAIFREVKRVLRDDGTLWVNIADSYSRNPLKGGSGPNGKHDYNPTCGAARQHVAANGTRLTVREKSLMLIPQRLAIALADDGWIIRQVFPWLKRNTLPGSQRDRPTSALEWWLMCTKEPHYFSDMEAVRMPGNPASHATDHSQSTHVDAHFRANGHPPQRGLAEGKAYAGRTYRNTDLWFQSILGYLTDAAPYGLVGVGEELVGLDVPTRGYSEDHYATFAPELIEPLLRLATSPHGACQTCKAPWTRIVTRETFGKHDDYQGKFADQEKNGAGRNLLASVKAARDNGQPHDNPFPPATTIGWKATCACGAPPSARCCVMDIFAGRGTVGLVAQRLGLDAVLIELNGGDVDESRKRLAAEAPLFQHNITVLTSESVS